MPITCPPILIPVSLLSSAFRMIISVYILNKYGDKMHPCLTPLPILNHSVLPYSVLTVASCLLYKLHNILIKCSGILISCSASHSFL